MPGFEVETHVEFRSDRFPPLGEEEKLINADRWGKRLADFLREGLRKQGFETTEPIAEDWGWAVPVVNDSFRLWIGCGNYQEYKDGFLCFIEPHKPSVWRFLSRIDTRGVVNALRQAMDEVLTVEFGRSIGGPTKNSTILRHRKEYQQVRNTSMSFKVWWVLFGFPLFIMAIAWLGLLSKWSTEVNAYS